MVTLYLKCVANQKVDKLLTITLIDSYFYHRLIVTDINLKYLLTVSSKQSRRI